LDKSHIWTTEGLKTARLSSPFKIAGFRSDNSPALINRDIINQRETVKTPGLSHSRSRSKNGDCFAGQKTTPVPGAMTPKRNRTPSIASTASRALLFQPQQETLTQDQV
jgi:hypothetical protein